MKRHATVPVRPDWDTIVLACRACRKRRHGPDGLSGKLAVREARVALKGTRPRPRVVATGCLGLCPDGAIALAAAGAGRAPRAIEVRDAADIGDAVRALLAAEGDDPPTR
jgi:predicted metal-dependent enzyme (double-stranded beta helix superfamily)